MFDKTHEIEAGFAAQTVPPSQPNPSDTLSRELLEHVCRLRLIRPVISISVMALHRQDAEADSDIASVLSESACYPLDHEIERVESLLASHAHAHSRRRRLQEAQA
jgi:hypothetical protein